MAYLSSVQVIAHSNLSQVLPLLMHMGKWLAVVNRCRTRGGSQQMYITFASTKVNEEEPTLALKPRLDITRNPKQGYLWPQNRTHIYAYIYVCVGQDFHKPDIHFGRTIYIRFNKCFCSYLFDIKCSFT